MSSAIFASQNTAVITGGASGIGLALAKKCVGHGMRVLVADWDEKNLEAAKSVLGDSASTIRADVSKTADWTAVRERVVEDFGGTECPCERGHHHNYVFYLFISLSFIHSFFLSFFRYTYIYV